MENVSGYLWCPFLKDSGIEREQKVLWGTERKMMNIYVGNLPYSTNNDELAGIFAPFGSVAAARVVMDRESGRSKGFGFVEMDNADEANAAIAALNNSEVGGRKVVVNEARPREERPRQPRGDYRR